ncbi:MAG: glycosyltransferase family 4 protein [Patescibacteria group bacterium]|jgi:glycosyltransferase involved in cell wall biosynthesis
MKIAQVVSTYPPYRGGMGAVAFEYTERLRSRGHNVHVFTPRYEKTVGDPEYVHRVPSPMHWGNAGVVPSLAYRLKGFDLVHLHYPFFGGAEPIIVRKYLQPHQPLVMTYHMDNKSSGLKNLLFDMHRRAILPWIVERADKILVSSRDYADTCALHEISGATNKIAIMPFGIDLERFHPGRDDAFRAALNFSLETPVLLFIGGLDRAHYFKGLSVLIEALADLKEKTWQLLVIGDGEMKESYMAQARMSGLSERIKFFGTISEEEKPRAYRAADIHVFPSIDRSEAFGLVALESAASGLPCIASDLPGVRSVVKNEETGLLVRPEGQAELTASIARLLDDASLRRFFGIAARRRAENEFAWTPLMDKLEGVYRELTDL